MKNLLLTGATGFVGSHLIEQLAKEQEFRVFALVRKQSEVSLLKKLKIQLLHASLSNHQQLEEVFESLKQQNIRLDAVVHCAAITKGKDLQEFMQVNHDGTGKLIELLKAYEHPLQKFVFLSSLAASGPTLLNGQIKIENKAPITDYGRSKLAAEALIEQAGLPYLIFRPTAVYGPREKDIFSVFKIISKGINPLIGTHKQQLTFIYVKDLVQLIIQGLHSSIANKAYFVSDGKVYSKQDLGNYINKSLKRKSLTIKIPLWVVKIMAYISQTIYGWRNKLSPLNLEKFKELKAQSWVCEIEPTFQDFDFKPRYDLQKGVSETSAWYQKEGWIV